MPTQDLALPTPFTHDAPAVDTLVAQLRATVLDQMTPAGLVPDRVTLSVVDEHLADALVWADLALIRQAQLQAEMLTVLLYSVDLDAPIEERLPRPQAEELFADTRDNGERWPAIVSAELVGPDGDVLDRW
jgi:hypothetical protein